MKRGELPPTGVALREVQRITAQEDRLRREKIALLKQELAKHRQRGTRARRVGHASVATAEADRQRSAGKFRKVGSRRSGGRTAGKARIVVKGEGA